jgi:hypothetical protein
MNSQKLDYKTVFISYIIVSLIAIYNILIPLNKQWNFIDNDMLTKYFVDNKYKYLFVNFVLVLSYLKSSEILPKNIPVISRRTISIIFLNVLFKYYLSSTTFESETINILKVWLDNMGWLAMLWDVIYINAVGYFADKLDESKLLKIKKIYYIFIIVFISIGLIHL